MNKDLISIVIPVYNIENYIEKCIKSIVQQTYENIEIIIVDDGSTDSSGTLCDQLGRNDKRIIVIHKENGGLSDARNKGIDRASGKYICFIDGDDFIAEDFITTLYNSLKNNNADLAVCEFDYIDNNGKRINHPIDSGALRILNTHDAIQILLQQKPYSNSACGKMFKLADFDNIKFPYRRLYEDTATVYKLFLKCNKVVFTAKAMYYYVWRNQSISKSGFSINQMDGLYYAELMVNEIVTVFPDLDELGMCRVLDPCISLMRTMPKDLYKNEYDIIWDKIKQIRKTVIKSRYSSPKRRIYALLSFLGERSFIQLIKKLH